jgi:hypothetical protein
MSSTIPFGWPRFDLSTSSRTSSPTTALCVGPRGLEEIDGVRHVATWYRPRNGHRRGWFSGRVKCPPGRSCPTRTRPYERGVVEACGGPKPGASSCRRRRCSIPWSLEDSGGTRERPSRHQECETRWAFESPALTSGQFQLHRVLRVTSAMYPGGYLVVELADQERRPLAALAMTSRGAFIMMEDRRPGGFGSLDLTVVDAKVRARRGRPALSTQYVYFHNPLEGGVSYCRPLVAVRTEEGVIYLNSRSEAFADESGAASREAAEASSDRVVLASGLRLGPMGKW